MIVDVGCEIVVDLNHTMIGRIVTKHKCFDTSILCRARHACLNLVSMSLGYETVQLNFFSSFDLPVRMLQTFATDTVSL
jgi:hypothetical protein